MPFKNVNGVNLNFTEKGVDIPVVFVHDALADHRSWDRQMAPFSKRYRVVAYSRRYHHPNNQDGDGSDYTATVHTEDLIGLIEQLNFGAVHLIGAAGGAYIALLAAQRRPDLVRTLVLAEPPAMQIIMNKQEPEILSSILDFQNNFLEPVRKNSIGNKSKGASTAAVAAAQAAYMGGSAFARVSKRDFDMWNRNAAAMAAGFLKPQPFEPFPSQAAQKLELPILLLDGEHSPLVLRFVNDELERMLPNTERTTIPNASVAPGLQIQNARTYNRTVLAFLDKHSTST